MSGVEQVRRCGLFASPRSIDAGPLPTLVSPAKARAQLYAGVIGLASLDHQNHRDWAPAFAGEACLFERGVGVIPDAWFRANDAHPARARIDAGSSPA